MCRPSGRTRGRSSRSISGGLSEVERSLAVLAQEESGLVMQEEEGERQKVLLDALREQVAALKAWQHWLQAAFQNMVFVMERALLLGIYHEFNAQFKHWFSCMIDEEVLAVRLDESFSPCVQQNGFETGVENLSGGERTALALAYRLALNASINSLVGSMRTRDFIILDEPTDGFSREQLDRLRDVFEQLRVRQVIIVSHEAQIESFVDHVVRVVKEGHVSRIAQA
ncbi:MAG: hypothetical protein HC945_02775 [Nitrosarchaeum sp.]|nr:hypothetical protein [Nitrosarchaeum sp.]